MSLRTRLGVVVVAASFIGISGTLTARQAPPERQRPARPDFDIRELRTPSPASERSRAELQRGRSRLRRGSRLDPHTGALRVLDAPGRTAARNALPLSLRNWLVSAVDRLGLDDDDLDGLTFVRDYTGRSNGVRHVTFAQAFDGIPVFDGEITVHIASNGEIVRVNSSAARGAGRRQAPSLTADQAAALASADIDPGTAFTPLPAGTGARPGSSRFARGPYRSDVTASLVWFASDGGVRLAWHVELEPEGPPQFYDVLLDADTGELLVRRNRVLDGNGTGRVLQSNATQAADARRPDAMPLGAASCPPPINHELRDLTVPFRDSGNVLFDGGRLSGNNVHVFRGDRTTEGALGTFNGTRWSFDFPFNSAEAAETALFFTLNFAHDFFYDLGFDEAAGNFQVNNFGRGGIGGDPLTGVARAAGRNNATFQPKPDGTSPIMSMFLWDGTNCWSEDVNNDGVADIDGDFDSDIVFHEYHHGVSTRLNTAFTGSEAGAIGEGGSDFFAYSINGNSVLAEYSYPGGLRTVNDKSYNDWTCQLFFCEVHDNGEIWANVLWDVRERFRLDLVRGSEAAAINEVHQLYVDALALSPPAPTMLDLRDAMMQADALRNPGSPVSHNFCALWEPFAARGMGLNATDTKDNGANQVSANFSVPAGCHAPPGPPLVTLAVADATATEAGPTPGMFTITREEATPVALVVNFMVAGTATRNTDYVGLPTSATIPAGAISVDVPVVPVDDSILEQNETVTLTLRSGSGYVLGGLSTGAVTIVSDDVAPDFTVTALTVPAMAGAGLTISVSDTTRNQGTGASGLSTTSFYLSANTLIEATDPVVGSRVVPGLAPGTNDTATTELTIPIGTAAGQYWIVAKADGPGTISESVETNNIRFALVKIGPDLAITAMTAPATAGPGTTILVNETTKNQGAGSAGASSTRYYLSANFSFEPGDTPLESRGVDALAPGASSTLSTFVTIPTTAASGTLYLLAVADDGNAVVEQTETNNTRSLAIRIGADLFVSAMTAPSRAGAGTAITITDTTKNSGGGGSGPSVTAFYLSANLTLEAGDTRLNAARSVGALDAGAQSVGTTTVTLPVVAPGTWYLIANADDANQVVEPVETNNVRTTTIYIGPDLTVATANAPVTVVAGTSMTITDTTKNLGPDTAAASTTRFYLSLNGAVDAGDILLDGTRSVPALGFNITSTGNTTVTVPTGISGRYYLLAVADDLGVVPEATEINNLFLRLITINP